ncbi:MAG TPA: hypothetical protein VFG45_06660 [Candidatus Nitrosocosmicus sp.]|nr:hypothetical protein [Candidatus Nitrosocosmicus sp.]
MIWWLDSVTISRYMHFLAKESCDSLNSLVKERMPFLYQTTIEGIKTVLNERWNIYNKDVDNEVTWRNKLNALILAKECFEIS